MARFLKKRERKAIHEGYMTAALRLDIFTFHWEIFNFRFPLEILFSSQEALYDVMSQ